LLIDGFPVAVAEAHTESEEKFFRGAAQSLAGEKEPFEDPGERRQESPGKRDHEENACACEEGDCENGGADGFEVGSLFPS
jgi:hypothetical protein